MVDGRDVAELLTTAAEYGVKVVEIGDWAQLKAIGADGGFKRAHEIVDGLELSENRRQKDTRNGPRWRRGWTAAAVPRCRCSPSTAASTRSVPQWPNGHGARSSCGSAGPPRPAAVSAAATSGGERRQGRDRGGHGAGPRGGATSRRRHGRRQRRTDKLSDRAVSSWAM